MWEEEWEMEQGGDEPVRGEGGLPGATATAPMGGDAPRPRKGLRKVAHTFKKATKKKGIWQSNEEEWNDSCEE